MTGGGASSAERLHALFATAASKGGIRNVRPTVARSPWARDHAGMIISARETEALPGGHSVRVLLSDGHRTAAAMFRRSKTTDRVTPAGLHTVGPCHTDAWYAEAHRLAQRVFDERRATLERLLPSRKPARAV